MTCGSEGAAAVAALDELEGMPLDDRITAVAQDVVAQLDRYRVLDPHMLAELLGIDDSWKP